MKMSDVHVGMRLRSTVALTPMDQFATVTELTERGFKYSLDSGYPMIPRWGMSVLKDGHENFGINGEALYEPVPEPARMTRREQAIEAALERWETTRIGLKDVINDLIDQAEAGKLKEPFPIMYAGINGVLTVYPDGRKERS